VQARLPGQNQNFAWRWLQNSARWPYRRP
jgi:hypothetical protein